MTRLSPKTSLLLHHPDPRSSFAARRLGENLAHQAKINNALLSLPALQVFFPSDPLTSQQLPSLLKTLNQKIESGKTLRQAFQALSQNEIHTLRSQIGEKNLGTLFSLSENSESGRFWKGLRRWGQNLKKQGKIDEALGVLGYLSGGGQGVPAQVQEKAQSEFDAMVGKGAIGACLEFLGSQFIKDATDYKMIIPMIAGSAVYQLVRTAALGRIEERRKTEVRFVVGGV